jgi:hypothetical protein
MRLATIRLELARGAGAPEGDSRHGYEFKAPLDRSGHIDEPSWRRNRAFCTVRRFTPDGDDEWGHLAHRGGHRWRFHYDIGPAGDDESGYRFDQHVFKPGEYVSITEHDGVMRTFKVAAVD